MQSFQIIFATWKTPVVLWFSLAADSFSIWQHRSAPTTQRNCRKNNWNKRIYRFPAFRRSRPRGTENDFCHELAQSPRWRYYSTAESLNESCNTQRKRSKRPSAGPEKTCMRAATRSSMFSRERLVETASRRENPNANPAKHYKHDETTGNPTKRH